MAMYLDAGIRDCGGAAVFTSLDDDPAIIARCQGTPVSPADEVKIVDEKDEEVPIGVFGELLSRGPYTIDGYYMDGRSNKTSFTDDGSTGRGTKAMWTENGRLRMGGRIKEQIKQKLPVEKEFGDSDNLLELGLSSIVIMRLVNQWRKQGVKVAFGTLMEHPTLNEWWEIIQKSMKKKEKKAKAEKQERIPERDMRESFP